MRAVYLKELKSYFNTLSAYVYIAFVLLCGGATFATANISEETTKLSAVFDSMQYALFIATPILTMRLVYGERGVDRVLFSAPVRTGAIVAGKYFAAVTVVLASVAASLVYPLILLLLGEPSWGVVASGFLGLFMLGATLVSAGTLVSAFASRRWAAGALALCLMLLILLAQAVIPGMSPLVKNVLIKTTPSYHVSAFLTGIIGLSDAVYFVALSALLVFLSVRVITYRMRYR